MRRRIPLFVGVILAALFGAGHDAALNAQPPFVLADGLFDLTRQDDLGLETAPGTKTVTVFQPRDADPCYNNGAVLMPFKGHLYCQWQSSATDEDAADTRVVMSRSEDGDHWSTPVAMLPVGGTLQTNGGW
jgi:hypothetical protein